MRAVPDLQSFRRLVAAADTVPVYREIAADLDTPVSAFLKLHGGGQAFLLESVEGGDRWGRYSVLAAEPLMALRIKGGRIDIRHRGGRRETRVDASGDPIAALE